MKHCSKNFPIKLLYFELRAKQIVYGDKNCISGRNYFDSRTILISCARNAFEQKTIDKTDDYS